MNSVRSWFDNAFARIMNCELNCCVAAAVAAAAAASRSAGEGSVQFKFFIHCQSSKSKTDASARQRMISDRQSPGTRHDDYRPDGRSGMIGYLMNVSQDSMRTVKILTNYRPPRSFYYAIGSETSKLITLEKPYQSVSHQLPCKLVPS